MDRRVTRIAIAQALYQIELMEEKDVAKVIDEFINDRKSLIEFYTEGTKIKETKATTNSRKRKKDIDEIRIHRTMFESILRGTIQNLAEIDEKIKEFISENWAYERVERVLKSILRAGVYELLYLCTPNKVVFNEYVEVTKCFYSDKKERSFINGVLHKISTKYLGKISEKDENLEPDDNT